MISGTVVQGIPTDHPANHQAQYSQPIYSHHSSLGFAGPVVFLVVGAGEDVEASSTRYSCLKRLLISGRLFGVFSSRFTGNYDCKSELSSLYENDAQVCVCLDRVWNGFVVSQRLLGHRADRSFVSVYSVCVCSVYFVIFRLNK